MNTYKKIIICMANCCMPIINNTVLFSSFYGQYNDNPKYISLLLHKKHPELKQIWVHSNKSNEIFPEYAHIVEFESSEYYKYVFRAQVVVDNYTGLRTKFFYKKNYIQRFISYIFAIKRKKQKNISTWHGTPLKHIALDEPNQNKLKDLFVSSDYIVSGCDLTKKALESGFKNKIPVRSYGTPRNDIFFGENYDVKNLKKKLGLPLNKKIILFAPTFRDNVEYSGIKQMKELDFHKLILELNNKFGGEWIFVFRVHQMVLKQIEVNKIVCDSVLNGNIGDDMAEYLVCADALITDYSGSMFDYVLTEKPIFLYTPDLEKYRNVERGFYMDFNSLPFPQANNSFELVKAIMNFDFDIYSKNIRTFMKLQHYVEDGQASDRIVQDIESFILKSKKI